MVAGDHLHADAGGPAPRHGLDGLGPRRVDDAVEPHERELAESDVVFVEVPVAFRRPGAAACARQHAQALVRQTVDCGVPEAPVQVPDFAGGAEFAGAHVQQAVGGALEQDRAGHRVATVRRCGARGGWQVRGCGGVVVDGHPLVVGVEGHVADAVVCAAVVTGLEREDAQRAVGRFADERPAGVRRPGGGDFLHLRFVGAVGDGGQHAHGRVVGDGPGQVAVGGVTGAGDGDRSGGDERFADRHFVLGQGAGLAGADHRHRPEGLHRAELAGDGVAAGHDLHAAGQGDGHDGRQSLGDRGDGETDGLQPDVDQRRPVDQAGHRHEQHREPDDEDRQLRAELRHRLRQRRFVDAEIGGAQQAQIGGHAVAGTEHDDVAGHQLIGRDRGRRTIAKHPRR